MVRTNCLHSYVIGKKRKNNVGNGCYERVNPVKIYIADVEDTLRKISQKISFPLEQLLSLNPAIRDPDLNLAGRQINLSELPAHDRNQSQVPICPYPPVIPAGVIAVGGTEGEEWIPLTTLEKMEQTEYDVLVVGTGAGGGAVLWRLIEQLKGSGKRVGIVERGGLLLPTHAWNIATMNDRFGAFFSKAAEIAAPHFPSSQVYALGGRTLFWDATSPRMPDSYIAEWPVSIKEMSILYDLAEKAMSVNQDYTKEASFTQILLKRLQKNGFPDAINEPVAINLQPSFTGVLRSNPFFSSLVLFAQAMNASFDMAVNARVVEVLMERDRAIGVKVMTPDKISHLIKAKHVVLSASTLGSAQILLNSDIKGRAIGHYLAGHSRVIAEGVVNRSEFPEVLGPLHILVPGAASRPYQIQIRGQYSWSQYQVEPLVQQLPVRFFASGEVESRYENKVTLDPVKRDAYGVPELRIDFSYSAQDERIIQNMAEGIRRAAATMGVSMEGMPDICQQLPGMEIHEMGTCRMGIDPMTSATNQYGQIHGVQGLYVADNSVIPTSGTANPTLTTVALAIRTADYIAEQLK